MKPNFILIGAILLTGALLGLRGQLQITSARKALQSAEAELASLSDHQKNLEAALRSLRTAIEEQERAAASASVAAAAEQRELAKADPEIAWVEPPRNLPEWNPDSPYLWVSKDILGRLPLEPFSEAGITPGVAAILALPEPERRALNEELLALVREFRELEAAHAQVITNHLPGIENGEKQTIVIHPLPEQGERLKERFVSAFYSTLGQQRAELLQTAGRGWLGEQFSGFGEKKKTISVVRHPNGGFNVSIQSAGSWLSTAGSQMEGLARYVPPHLMQFFSHLMQPPLDPAVPSFHATGAPITPAQ